MRRGVRGGLSVDIHACLYTFTFPCQPQGRGGFTRLSLKQSKGPGRPDGVRQSSVISVLPEGSPLQVGGRRDAREMGLIGVGLVYVSVAPLPTEEATHTLPGIGGRRNQHRRHRQGHQEGHREHYERNSRHERGLRTWSVHASAERARKTGREQQNASAVPVRPPSACCLRLLQWPFPSA